MLPKSCELKGRQGSTSREQNAHIVWGEPEGGTSASVFNICDWLLVWEWKDLFFKLCWCRKKIGS